jgi:hypothetical protein
MSKKSVLGTAKTRSQAETIVDHLHSVGFNYDDVSVIFLNEDTTRDFAISNQTKAPEGAATGAGIGGVLGGTLGLLAGLGALVIPGLGPLVAAGPIMGALSGAAVGAAVGGIAGGLIAMGIPEYEAQIYEGKVREGNILIAVHAETNEQIKSATDIFERDGADNISSVTETGVTRGSRWDNPPDNDLRYRQTYGK